ncbi:MAG: phosphoribosylformylglycinamidine cyclo-ligase [Chloroflexi bacterium]|nr:phosphoribosylformylglycinamidine cyclo-ligase [Chloroflexota bacterium]
MSTSRSFAHAQHDTQARASTYAAAGVDIDAGERAVGLIKGAVRSTFGPRVLGDLGAFGGLFALGASYRDPVLVSSTDGVGTKLKVAIALDRHDTIGRDLVAHCVDDILTTGAEPLFFLDYVALGELIPERVAQIVEGMAAECRANGCALIGGETAEMPDVYRADDYDLAGFIVGVVERDWIVDGSRIRAGDLVWGIESSGLHTNGYSLARRALADLSLHGVHPRLGRPLGDVLLEPHRSYLPTMRPLLEAGLVHGMAHITGGGIVGNIPRVLPDGLTVELDWGAWSVPPIFDLIQELGVVSFEEMTRVFNMGLGWVFIAASEEAEQVRMRAPEARPVGRVVAASTDERVRLLGAP